MWFLYANELGIAPADPGGGGCRDGLRSHRANANWETESTLAQPYADLTMAELEMVELTAADATTG